ncbi:MAG TPA: DUF1127 domain-containing protein [Thermohalobaculum sp.]|nr:DUF1127 domain-containing protein [Thermohalobaculum sp.]
MLTILTRSALRWMEEHRRRAQLRGLLEKDDRMLEDIGLTRGDIEEALSRPMQADAREHAYRAATRSLALDGLR